MSFPVNEFFNTGLEADAVLETASGTSTIKVHFLNEYESLGQEIQFESSGLVIHAKTEDVSDAAHEDKITIEDAEYYIKELHPDGTGITVIIMSTEK